MSRQGWKETPLYAAFRRARARLRERLRLLGLRIDARIGAPRLRRASQAALVAGGELQLHALATLLEQVRRLEAADQAAHVRTRLEALSDQVRRLEEAWQASPGHGNAGAVQTSTAALLEPELDLLARLAPRLPHPVAVDVGANAGDVSAVLLDAGLEVHAFEPNPATAQALRARLGGAAGLHVHPEALGSEDGEADLHLVEDRTPDGRFQDGSLYASLRVHELPEGLAFSGAIRVRLRRLDTLHARGDLPAAVGLVKIDTEGLDLEVVRGMGPRRYPVVMCEFWDRDHPFARSGAGNLLRDLVPEMRRRGYQEHLVLTRTWGNGECTFYCNLGDSAEGAWGNVLFFSDRALFDEARRFCEAALPPARFRPHWPARPRR